MAFDEHLGKAYWQVFRYIKYNQPVDFQDPLASRDQPVHLGTATFDMDVYHSEVLETISDTFSMTMEEAEIKINEWKEISNSKLIENEDLNIYTVLTSEPGPLITVGKTTKDVVFMINDCTSISEFNNILI